MLWCNFFSPHFSGIWRLTECAALDARNVNFFKVDLREIGGQILIESKINLIKTIFSVKPDKFHPSNLFKKNITVHKFALRATKVVQVNLHAWKKFRAKNMKTIVDNNCCDSWEMQSFTCSRCCHESARMFENYFSISLLLFGSYLVIALSIKMFPMFMLNKLSHEIHILGNKYFPFCSLLSSCRVHSCFH